MPQVPGMPGLNPAWDATGTVDIGMGQRLVPSVHGDQTLAAAYAGFGTRHIFILADGGAGFVPTRLAAEVAVAAALGRIRASALPDFRAVVAEAFGEAHQAVRRALIGTAAEAEGGTALLILVLEAAGVYAARVGRGRLYVVGKDRRGGARVLFSAGSDAVLGRLGPLVALETTEAPLSYGDRLVLLSESALRPLAADLAQLVMGQPPQLAAQRVADAARRRGEADAIACAIMEWNSDTPRATHPALPFIDPGASRESPLAGSAEARHPRRAPSGGAGGMVIWFLIAAGLGTGTSLIVHPPHDRAPKVARNEAPEVASEAALDAYASPEPGAESVAGDGYAAAGDAVTTDDGLGALFGAADAAAGDVAKAANTGGKTAEDAAATLATGIRRYVIARFAADGELVFQRLDARVRAATRRPVVIQALVILARDAGLPRTARWAAETLPLLYR